LTEPNIGLSDPDFDIITSQTNVILHCAGIVDGNEQIEKAVKVNRPRIPRIYGMASY
jgi:thioester reductase-like protein